MMNESRQRFENVMPTITIVAGAASYFAGGASGRERSVIWSEAHSFRFQLRATPARKEEQIRQRLSSRRIARES